MEWIVAYLSHLGAGWLAGALGILWLLDKTGFVQSWFAKQHERRHTEREQLSDDTQQFISNLREELQQERKRRRDDLDWYLVQMRQQRAEIEARDQTVHRLSETALLSERGNARLRHGLNNAFTYIAALRNQLRKNGVAVPPYDGWHDMMGVSSDLDEVLKELFESGEKSA